jgi:peptide/nickel transport system permease protein
VWHYLVKRLGAGIVLLFAISTLTYTLLIIGAGDVGRQILGVNATNEQAAAYNKDLGLNRPVLVQYGDWLRKAVRGNLGSSWFKGQPVWSLLKARIPITVTIVGLSVLVAALAAAVLGVAAAVRGRKVDRGVQLLGLLGFAVPGFLIAFGLVTLFSVRFHVFRATGYVTPGESITGWLKSVTLPVISLSFATLAMVALQIRGSVRDALDLDYVRTLRSRGLSARRTVFKHILRNAAGPALSIIGVQFIGLLGGAVIIEQIFAIPGLGTTAVQASTQGDVPMVMGLVLVTAILVVLMNLLVDLFTAWLNPKVRLS